MTALFDLGRRVIPLVCLGSLLQVGLGVETETLVDRAESAGWLGVAQALERGADPNRTQSDGMSALHWAVYHENLEVARRLLENGAQVDACNDYGVSPLGLACLNGNADLVRLLLDAGASPEPLPEGLEAPLIVAARVGRPEVIEALMDAGATVDVRGGKGQAPIHWAAAEGHAEAVGLLIAKGADPSVTLSNGFTPLLVTTEGGEDQTGLVERLLNYSVAGMMITSGTPSSGIIEECARLQVPVVLINRDASLQGADRVLIDIHASGRMAFDMLHASGGTRFAVLCPRDRTYSVLGRATAFATCCADAGFSVDEIEVASQDYEAGLAAADRFVATSKADAVFCTNDLLALGFLDGLRLRHGVSVPDQVQVLGFDDIPQAAWLSNNLSTVRQSLEAAGKDAVALILDRIANPARPHETRYISILPVHRGTTRKPVS